MRIAGREARIGAITRDLISLDQSIESRIDEILKQLGQVTDSKDSGSRIARAKADIVERLKKSIEVYHQKRRNISGERDKNRPAVDREILQGDIVKFDERIEKRIGQIVDLNLTLTEDENYQKYITTYRDRGRWTRRSTRINPNYRHNSITADRTRSERRQLATALEESIDDLDRQIRTLRERAAKHPSAELRALLEEDAERLEASRADRANQLENLEEGSPGGQQAVKRDEASDLIAMIDEQIDDIREDFHRFFGRYYELNRERATVARLKTRLAAMKAADEKKQP